MRNVEIKAKVRNVSLLLDKARLLSNSNGVVIPQHDTFYSIPQGRLKLRQFESGDAELIYYERTDMEGPKMSSYDKCGLNAENVQGLQKVLTRALGITGTVKKVRQLFMVEQTRIHVDSVEGLGDFMELEVALDENQSTEEGETIAYSLMDKLGIEKSDLLASAYTDLLKK